MVGTNMRADPCIMFYCFSHLTYKSIAGNPFDTGGGILSPLPPDHAEMIAENEVKDSLPLYEDSAHPDSDSQAVVPRLKGGGNVVHLANKGSSNCHQMRRY